MGTRAIVAVPYGDTWRGRHSHWDGYPTGRAKNLWAIVKRDGIDQARRVLTADYYGWSSINADQADLSKIKVPAKFKDSHAVGEAFGWDSPEYHAFNWRQYNHNGQFQIVVGYGNAYTSEPLSGVLSGQVQSSEDEWITPEDPIDTEWAYVLADDGLWVFKCHFKPNPNLVGVYRWDDPEPDWEAVEAKGEGCC